MAQINDKCRVETGPSRAETLRTPELARSFRAGDSALRLKSVEGVRRDLQERIASSSAAPVLAALLKAREALVEYGWVRGELLVDKSGAPRGWVAGDPFTLLSALNTADMTAARWHARLLVQRIAGHPNLVEWNAHPYRQARDVEAVLDTAIRELGGVPPSSRIREWGVSRRRGGWTVTTGVQR